MPKPIINTNGKQLDLNFTGEKQLSMLNSALEERNTFKSSELALRKKRPQAYMDLIKNLDIEGEKISEERLNDIIEQMKCSVPDIVLDDSFYGVLGKCHLERDYDVHTLSKKVIFGIDEKTHQLGYGRMILKHFHSTENLPDGLEKGRSLAANSNYAFVEVYSDKLIAIQNDGTVSIIKD